MSRKGRTSPAMVCVTDRVKTFAVYDDKGRLRFKWEPLPERSRRAPEVQIFCPVGQVIEHRASRYGRTCSVADAEGRLSVRHYLSAPGREPVAAARSRKKTTPTP